MVGLGNDHITADALGPAVCGRILVTRHIPIERDERDILHLRGVSTLCPGIEGKTGLSAGETVKSVVGAVRPAAVLCIDSLFTSSPEHLGCTVQITDTGLCPGGEERKRIDTELLGVPTVCMGVPTVMDAGDLCNSRHRLGGHAPRRSTTSSPGGQWCSALPSTRPCSRSSAWES